MAKLTAKELTWAKRYFRATNYLAASMVYLQDNFLVERPLKSVDIKQSLLGHWGTCPGINFIHTHLNLLVHKTKQSTLLITGPGHGFAAVLASQFLDGSLEDVIPKYKRDALGFTNVIKDFCWPGGFPSHLNPGVPGCIHEGGELGYSLATSFGAVLDNPELMVACIVGDGEAETGPTATAWHSTKFLNPKTDGSVLPILHLNGYKISSPTIYGTMTDTELTHLFTGYGYEPKIVGTSHQSMASALSWAHDRIKQIQTAARKKKAQVRPKWPMIILRSPKGWTGPKTFNGKKVEGSYRSHQVPLTDPKKNSKTLAILQDWLQSYNPQELFPFKQPAKELFDFMPTGDLRIGSNPHALGGKMRKPLKMPNPHHFEVKFKKRGCESASTMEVAGEYFNELIKKNTNFRIMSPDELSSNKLDAVLKSTGRQYNWPHDKDDNTLVPRGQVMEMLSEHTLQAWLQGYILTGRHGLFPSYEAFLPIVDSMISQYLKFIELSQGLPWREPVSCLNYILTSVCWRQDHNGFSHQNPGFISNLLTKAKEVTLVRIYLPADANIMLNILDHSLQSTDRVNAIVADKRPIRQWLTYNEAKAQCERGAATWEFASNKNPDVVLAAAGDYQTQESLAAIDILRKLAPDLKVRFVNVNELNVLGKPGFYSNGLDAKTFSKLFTFDKHVIFSFHGYPGSVKQLLFDRPISGRFHVYGYIEKGTTTTPFDMLVRNNISRYHLAIRAIKYGAWNNPKINKVAQSLIATLKSQINEHQAYIKEHGADPQEINDWKWQS